MFEEEGSGRCQHPKMFRLKTRENELVLGTAENAGKCPPHLWCLNATAGLNCLPQSFLACTLSLDPVNMLFTVR